MNTRLKYWFRALKIVIWISILGFGLTLFNSIYRMTKSDELVTEVKLTKSRFSSLEQGKLDLNSGMYLFNSKSLSDRLIFKHKVGKWGFLESLFSLTTCVLLLLTVNGISTDNPFNLKVAQRIIAMGIVYIAFGVINIATSYYMYAKIAHMENEVTVRYIGFPDDLSRIKTGIIILVISFVYRIGVTYQDENKLTV